MSTRREELRPFVEVGASVHDFHFLRQAKSFSSHTWVARVVNVCIILYKYVIFIKFTISLNVIIFYRWSR